MTKKQYSSYLRHDKRVRRKVKKNRVRGRRDWKEVAHVSAQSASQ